MIITFVDILIYVLKAKLKIPDFFELWPLFKKSNFLWDLNGRNIQSPAENVREVSWIIVFGSLGGSEAAWKI